MRIKRGYRVRNIAGESVIVAHVGSGMNMSEVIALNPTSAWLWDKLGDSEFTEERVAALLTENYDVAPDRALADSRNWINSLREAGLIEE